MFNKSSLLKVIFFRQWFGYEKFFFFLATGLTTLLLIVRKDQLMFSQSELGDGI